MCHQQALIERLLASVNRVELERVEGFVVGRCCLSFARSLAPLLPDYHIRIIDWPISPHKYLLFIARK